MVAFFILKLSLKTASDIWVKLNPPPPPPPTVAFGRLPPLVFPASNLPTEAKLSFALETIEGGLPKLPTIGKVYFMPQNTPNLLALDRAVERAKKMGFRSQPEKISENVYRFFNDQVPSTSLEMNVINLSFRLRYEYENDQTILDNKNLPTDQQGLQEAKNYLSTHGFLTEDLATGSAQFEYLRFQPPELIAAPSLSEADFLRVYLSRSDFDGLKILPPIPKQGLISFLFSGAREPGRRIIEIKYNHYPIETKIYATYPLRPIESAWQELQSGKAYIATLGQNTEGKITVRKVYLAYFDSPEPQHFLQPIYVFEGDRNFFAYVAALDPKWTEQVPPTNSARTASRLR